MWVSFSRNHTKRSEQSKQKVKVAQLYPTLCDPTDYTVHGILQGRIPEWVAFPSSRASSWPRDRSCVSYICLLWGGFLFTSAIFQSLCESRSAEITQRQREQSKQWESESCPVVSNSLWPHGIYSPWNSPRKNTGVSSISLLQGICPTQGSNPGIPNCRQILHQLSHKESPSILEWVAYPFSSRSSSPRNRTLYCRMILYHWAISSVAR